MGRARVLWKGHGRLVFARFCRFYRTCRHEHVGGGVALAAGPALVALRGVVVAGD